MSHRQRLDTDGQGGGEVERMNHLNIGELLQGMANQCLDDRTILMSVQPEDQAGIVPRPTRVGHHAAQRPRPIVQNIYRQPIEFRPPAAIDRCPASHRLRQHGLVAGRLAR